MSKKVMDIPSWGRAIKARRNYLGKSGMDIENATGGSVRQDLISKIERGKKEPKDLFARQLDLLLEQLEWSPEEFVQQTGYKEVFKTQPIMQPRPLGATVGVRHFGTVRAGLLSYMGEEDNRRMIETPVEFLGKADPKNCYWLDVSGDSMACRDVKRAIPEGSQVLVDSSKTPEAGHVCVVELHRDGEVFNVLKVYRPNDRHVILESYNENHAPIVLQEGDRAICKGVCIYVGRTLNGFRL